MDGGCSVALGSGLAGPPEALVVRVALTSALGEVASHECFARWASNVASKGKSVGESVVRLRITTTRDEFLNPSKLCGRDHRDMPAWILVSGPWISNNAGVIRIAEHMIEQLSRDQTTSISEHTAAAKEAHDRCLCVCTGGKHLPRTL